MSDHRLAALPPDHAANRLACDGWLDDFFAHYYARRPVNATFIGVHDHDHTLPNLSPDGLAATNTEMHQQRRRLSTIPTEGLDEPRRHDRLLADAFLELQLMEDELPHFHRGNPSFYTGEAIFSIISLFLRDIAPLADRVEAATTRLETIPDFLAQARANVATAPPAWTERALREARAAAAYLERGLPSLFDRPTAAYRRFLAAAAIARDAFANHAGWLADELTARPLETVACGRAAFDRYLSRGHMMPPERDSVWLAQHAAQAVTSARERLTEHARSLDPTRPWSEQLADLAADHPPAADYLASFPRLWQAAQDAALAHDLLTWPDFPIVFAPIPPSDRDAAEGLYYLYYRCPTPGRWQEIHRYLVPPIDPELDPAEQERRLRVTNTAVIKLNHIVHHGSIGHHVQNYYAFRAASRLGRIAGVDCASRIALFAAGTLVEGWACYATDLMAEIGFFTPGELLAHLHGQLRLATRALADVAFHTGALTLDETAALFAREAGMADGPAHAEAVRTSMFPGAAMMYLVGTEAIHDLRHTLSARDGAAFSLGAFHDRFLSYGAIPVSLIAASIAPPDDASRRNQNDRLPPDSSRPSDFPSQHARLNEG